MVHSSTAPPEGHPSYLSRRVSAPIRSVSRSRFAPPELVPVLQLLSVAQSPTVVHAPGKGPYAVPPSNGMTVSAVPWTSSTEILSSGAHREMTDHCAPASE